jgi:rhodanese-related sulfurtransferase
MPKMIELEEVQQLIGEGAQLLDVMSREAYDDSHLPGAIHISLKELDEQTAARLDRDRPVITYCSDYQCDMSPRAAWRLEELGFTKVYDYVPSKIDWFANGLPREGKAAETPWTGDLARDDVPTCAPNDRVGDIRERVLASGYDLCVVVNEHNVVLGLLRGDALSKDPNANVGDVMELGPKTQRPDNPVEKLLQSRANQGVKNWIVTTSHGVLLGVVLRADAERALEQSRARAAA